MCFPLCSTCSGYDVSQERMINFLYSYHNLLTRLINVDGGCSLKIDFRKQPLATIGELCEKIVLKHSPNVSGGVKSGEQEEYGMSAS